MSKIQVTVPKLPQEMEEAYQERKRARREARERGEDPDRGRPVHGLRGTDDGPLPEGAQVYGVEVTMSIYPVESEVGPDAN